MGHGITDTDAFGHVGQRAWHGLGMALEEGLSVVDAFDRLGLGWETDLYQVPPLVLPDGREVRCPDHRLHIRRDTAECLGVVSGNYVPIPNKQMAEFADALVGQDKAVRVETGGSLRGGRRVFALVKLPNDTEVLDGDDLRNYVCISNGHDGMNAFRVFYTPIRVVCANTLAMAETSVGGARFAHDGDVKQKIEAARAALGILVKRSETFAQQARALAKVQMTQREIEDYFGRVYDATFGEGKSEDHTKSVLTQWKDNMTRSDNRVLSTSGTAWQAMNAVTYWHDHQRGRMKDLSESPARIHSNLFGASAGDKRIALRAAMALVKS